MPLISSLFYLALGWCLLGLSSLFAVHACYAQESRSRQAIVFSDVTQAGGLDFVHDDGGTEQQFLFELMSAGAASLDFDRDGRFDAYLLNGENLIDPRVERTGNGLFRNLGQWNWSDVGAVAGADSLGFALGVTAADYDCDGFQDLYVSNYGVNILLHNNGDGTFSETTELAGVQDGERFGAGVAFLDFDGDQDLDLLVGAYVDFSFERHAEVAPKAYPFPPGPKDFPPLNDRLYRNEGDGTFTDWTEASQLNLVAGPTMGLTCGDFDADGDTDVFVCCDGAPDFLYRNLGNGKFEEDGILSGVAYDQAGMANGSMGVDAADVNRDGICDLFVTDYSAQTPMLFISDQGGFFTDESVRRQAGRTVLPHVNWGTAWADFELDGDMDLLILNGHFLTDTAATGTSTSYRVANTVLEQIGNLRFSDASEVAGLPLRKEQSSRSCVVEDFDNDGDLDAIILNCASAAQVLKNDQQTGNKWLKIDLVGTVSNRDGVGAKVSFLSEGGQLWYAEARSGRGYQSHFGSQIHFGLGQATSGELRIAWPSGVQQVLPLETLNTRMTVVEPID